MIGHWIEAMRLRTLPVSVAGVLAGTGCAVLEGGFSPVPAVLCLLFAVLAQVAANFGNEYYDYRNGLDRKGRDGFRRGVTEGDITPRAMKTATFLTLALAAAVGCAMLFYGEPWIIIVGILVGIFAIAYSAGPYPLSHHGLGDVAVVIFFGIVPVTLTCYLQQGDWSGLAVSLPVSVSVGLLAANVLVVNNYRDVDDDRSAGKRTTVVIFGRPAMSCAYLLSGIAAMLILVPLWLRLPVWALSVPAVYLVLHIALWNRLRLSTGPALNPILGRTAFNLLMFSVLFLAVCVMN